MRQQYLQLRNLIAFNLISLLISSSTHAGDAIPQAQPPSAVVTVEDSSGSDSFAAVDNGPANISVYIDQGTQSANAARLTQGPERITQERTVSGDERLVYERSVGASEQRLEFRVNRETNELNLVSASSTREVMVETPIKAPSRPSDQPGCFDESTGAAIVEAGFALDLKARATKLNSPQVAKNCGSKQSTIATSAAALVSTEAKRSKRYLACAADFPRYKNAALEAISQISLPKQPLLTCSKDEITTKAGLNISIGTNVLNAPEDQRRLELMKVFLRATGFVDQNEANGIAACCSEIVESANACRMMRMLSGTDVTLGIRAYEFVLNAYKSGKSDEQIRSFLKEVLEQQRIIAQVGARSDKKAQLRKIVEICKDKIGGRLCDSLKEIELTGTAESFSPSRDQVAQISATSNPAAQSPAQQPGAKPGTTTPTPALPQLNQRITYQRNDPASVRQALKKYEYMGPLAAAARKTADSISAQVSNVAVAATDGPSGASSEGFSYQSEPVQFKTGGGSISRIQVGNRSVYVKSTIPFGNRVGEPQTSVGSSPENLQPVSNTIARAKPQDPKRAAAATTGSSSAALDSTGGGSQEPLSSGGGVGPSAQTPSARTGGGSRSVSSAQQSRFKSVTEFNTALVNEKNPRQFLSQSTETLRELKLQIVLKGESFPRNPDYNPRIYDFDELKRMMKR